MSRLHIDWTRCDGHGACAELLPELLQADEWGYPVPVDGERDPIVPPQLTNRAGHAIRTCPLMALRLIDSPRPGSHLNAGIHRRQMGASDELSA